MVFFVIKWHIGARFVYKVNIQGLPDNISDAFQKISTWSHGDATQSVKNITRILILVGMAQYPRI